MRQSRIARKRSSPPCAATDSRRISSPLCAAPTSAPNRNKIKTLFQEDDMRGLFMVFLALAGIGRAQEQDITSIRSVPKAPPRAEGEGPFPRLILRGATLIDGTGAPPVGPVDDVVEGNVIRSVQSVGYPGVPIDPASRPKAGASDKELDLSGMYLLPGFIDMHGHI